jgi:hypothetical protein
MTDALTTPAAQSLLQQAVTERDVVVEGFYTNPRTWGVYEIEPPGNGRSTRRFRIGNHPVRQQELEREFGQATPIALFQMRALAVALERLLNAR